MTSPAEDIKTAREICLYLYGEDFVWCEVRTMLWLREAEKVKSQLRVSTLQEALLQVREIPFYMDKQTSRLL